MNQLNGQKVALTVGLFFGGWHILWSILVATGIGQALINFILWAHMIHAEHVVGPFNFTTSIVLVVVTALIGYVFGWVFAYLWNWLYRPRT